MVPLTEVVHDRLNVEVFRGCTRGCRFCQAGMITRPVRERPAEQVSAMVREGLARTGYDEVALTSLSSADFSGIAETVEEIVESDTEGRISVSLPSLRVDAFGVDIAAQVQKGRRTGLTFAPEGEAQILEEHGFLHRIDQQFHFTNQGYAGYEDFLGTLASRKRKALKKERRTALENGISVEWLTGSDLTESVWDDFHAFYMDTGSRKWGRPYLNRRFFSLIGERMANDILLIMARRDGRYIGGAINFIGADTLYGRHWGCIEDHPFLHFEICYHQAIDFAIANGLRTVEAGAQGEHKLARGYLPVTTHSAHWIGHEGLRNAVADYLEHERRDVRQLGDLLAGHAPFRKEGDGTP